MSLDQKTKAQECFLPQKMRLTHTSDTERPALPVEGRRRRHCRNPAPATACVYSTEATPDSSHRPFRGPTKSKGSKGFLEGPRGTGQWTDTSQWQTGDPIPHPPHSDSATCL